MRKESALSPKALEGLRARLHQPRHLGPLCEHSRRDPSTFFDLGSRAAEKLRSSGAVEQMASSSAKELLERSLPQLRAQLGCRVFFGASVQPNAGQDSVASTQPFGCSVIPCTGTLVLVQC